MNKFIMGIALVVMAILIFWVGQDRLSNAATRNAEGALAALERYEAQRKQEQDHQAALRSGPDWPLVASLEREWNAALQEADKHIQAARSIVRERAKPLLDKNDAADEAALASAVKDIQAELKQAQPLLPQGRERAQGMLAAAAQVERTARWASEQWRKTDADLARAYTLIADAQQKYPQKNTDLTKYERELTDLAEAITARVEALQAQRRRSAQDVDRVVVAQTYDALNRGFTDLNAKIERYSQETESLSHSLVRVLKDQKIEYAVRIGRAAWCEDDGCSRGDTFIYPPKQVSPETLAGLERHAGPIAEYKPRLFSENLQLRVDAKVWVGLGLDPKKNWPARWYDHAEYWLESVQAQAFHQYVEIEDGETKPSAWTPVSMALFQRHEAHLGMAIFTKPYGAFASEANTKAEPAGMALIAEPKLENGVPTGSNAYGEWRTDAGGNSFWFYYGMSRILGDLLGGYRYRYNDWDRYRGRNRNRDYYGGGGGKS